jgi:hypothetical protein
MTKVVDPATRTVLYSFDPGNLLTEIVVLPSTTATT